MEGKTGACLVLRPRTFFNLLSFPTTLSSSHWSLIPPFSYRRHGAFPSTSRFLAQGHVSLLLPAQCSKSPSSGQNQRNSFPWTMLRKETSPGSIHLCSPHLQGHGRRVLLSSEFERHHCGSAPVRCSIGSGLGR